jgi:hypothetical protein
MLIGKAGPEVHPVGTRRLMFPDVASAQAAVNSDVMTGAHRGVRPGWGTRVTRTRESIEANTG